MIRRYTPLKRGTKKLKSSGKPLARSGRLSAKRKQPSPVLVERDRLYREALAEIRAERGPGCEVPRCRRLHTDPHHTHGRHGSNLYDKTKIKMVCRKCHDQLHHDPAWGREIGFMQPRPF